MTDTERIDWLEENMGIAGGGIFSDDNGHWAVASDGFQNVPTGKKPKDISTTFFIEAKRWKNSIRRAIDSAMQED